MAYYDSSGSSKLAFCLAVTICLMLTYFVQTCCFFIWSRIVFPHTYPGGLGDIYFAYLNFFEFSWFLFARTRLTLKYYPKIVTVLNIAFFCYINSYNYAASMQFLFFILSFNILVLFVFLQEVESPAIQKWSPFDVNTPAIFRPRIGHHEVLNDTNYGTGLYIWTAFMPLKGRQQF